MAAQALITQMGVLAAVAVVPGLLVVMLFLRMQETAAQALQVRLPARLSATRVAAVVLCI
jgi:hypothetical protein